MSPKAIDDIKFEFVQILKEAELTKILIPLFEQKSIDEIQIRAAASCVHSIYNGIEQIFVLLLKDMKIALPNGSKWHSELLTMIYAREIISENSYALLRDYLSFRHFFRHTYGFYLDRDLLFPLVKKAIQMIERVKKEILSGA